MPEKTEAQKKAQKSYIKKFSRVEIRMEKDEYKEVQAYAETRGESVNAFINRAIRETIFRDKEKAES